MSISQEDNGSPLSNPEVDFGKLIKPNNVTNLKMEPKRGSISNQTFKEFQD